jgi:hypothetical protein
MVKIHHKYANIALLLFMVGAERKKNRQVSLCVNEFSWIGSIF